MKIICERDRLDAAIKHVIGRAKSKSKIPILSHLLIAADSNVLTLTATDLDTESRAPTKAEVSVAGACVVPGERFARLVGEFPTGSQVTIESTKIEATVKCGRSTYRLPTLDPADWPSMSTPANPVSFTLDAASAKRLLSIPQIAVETSGGSFFLQGGYLHQAEKGKISVVATNRHKLLRVTCDGELPVQTGWIVPKPAMAEFVRLASGEMKFECGNNLISVTTDACTFTSKLIEATYPGFERVIPEASGSSVLVDREDFASALKRLEFVSGERSFLKFAWEEGGSSITASLTGEGSGEEVIAGEIDMPGAGSIRFASDLLRSVLDVFEGETLRIYIGDTNAAVRIVDALAPDLTAVVMPLQG